MSRLLLALATFQCLCGFSAAYARGLVRGRGPAAHAFKKRARVSSPGWGFNGRLATVDGRSAPADGLVSALPPALMERGDFVVSDVFTVGAYPHSDCGLLRMKDAETPFSGGVAPAMGAVCGFGPGFHTVLLAGRPAFIVPCPLLRAGIGIFLAVRVDSCAPRTSGAAR